MSDSVKPALQQDYEVGRNKPPIATRFKPGQSGNPAGKKPGTRSLKAMVLAAAFAKPRARGSYDDVERFENHLEAMFARLFDSAAHGNPRAIAQVLESCGAYLAEQECDDGPAEEPGAPAATEGEAPP